MLIPSCRSPSRSSMGGKPLMEPSIPWRQTSKEQKRFLRAQCNLASDPGDVGILPLSTSRSIHSRHRETCQTFLGPRRKSTSLVVAHCAHHYCSIDSNRHRCVRELSIGRLHIERFINKAFLNRRPWRARSTYLSNVSLVRKPRSPAMT